MKVLAAMSGGVDSAVAAARLVAAGHEVTGVHLALNRNPQPYREGSRGCCSLEDAHDARRAADLLDIPFYVWDFSEEFQDAVVADFVAEYREGRTPNPCLRCNERIKFEAVLERGLALGFDAVATGHYARLEINQGEVELHRAGDPRKDQSYVLGVLQQEQLRHSLFPLADTPKPEVRAEAAALGLRVATKPDSYDICFIPDGDTQGFLREHLGEQVGPVVDEAGTRLGSHRGHHGFTVGQRRGLDLGVPAPDGRPRYVLRIEPASNTVVVGPREALAARLLDGIRVTWTQAPLTGPLHGQVQYRAHGAALPGLIEPTDEGVRVTLDDPTQGVAPGQSMVFFDGTRVVGSAIIRSAR
ncbi:tRNA 2-thiouridine(34) synthase MnmA [Arachnia propionica]|uniref:tRNA-specific 2-thiouridylase MnmA n=1 Tax=Arachnia propionica TaxID=1750 RepID=A0A3P1TDB2_9ACTN|nr:tRNA 2-thiouridine(34) synthase MnmA [Arachnia propionica]MDO5081879.1 tRNA 2-thiouridine(34) synthase MnmA [Arachnia propionica]RRD07429.1 tRNA 2-thiouridine(34) synthase MnmA [Arachnia propionica]